MARTKPQVGEYYHVYNRGTDERLVFLDEEDYQRFLTGVDEFNDIRSIPNLFRKRSTLQNIPRNQETRLVEIICYCLMPNHYHFIIKVVREGGLSKFIQKLGTGYTKYFNIKYQRSGVLFQGKYKSIHIEHSSYLLHLSRYIHLNPLDILIPSWRKKKFSIRNKMPFLMEYKYSSLQYFLKDLQGLPNRSSIEVYPEIILDDVGGAHAYKEFIEGWIREEMDKLSDYIKDCN